MFAGFFIAGLWAILEAAWLMFRRTLDFGVFNESLLLLESFGFYLLAGAIIGAIVGVTVYLTARAFQHRPSSSQLFLNTIAGILGLLVAGALTTFTFGSLLPSEVALGEFYGILAMIAILVITVGALLGSRWIFLKVFGTFLDRRLEKKSFLVMMTAGVILPIIILSGVQHIQMSSKKAALDQAAPDERNAPRNLPNVILITLDTVRAANVSLYGYERQTTPNLAEFASTSVVYECAVSHSSWTLPSHQTIFTGRYPSELSEKWGATRLQDAHITLAEIVNLIGYRTGGVIAGPQCSGVYGFSQGFDYYEDRLPIYTPFLSQLVNRLVPNLFSAVGKRRADQNNDFVFRWLERNSSLPFFLFINYFDPHLRTNPPFPYRNAFDGSYGAIRSFLMSQGDMESDVTEGRRDLSDAEKKHWITLYDCEILFLDSELGRLFGKLKELGVYDNSLIVITSDHGHSYGEHHLAGHGGWIFEESVKVPLIIRYPGGRLGGTRVPERFGLINLFSLILSELNLPIPETAHSSKRLEKEGLCILENGRKNTMSEKKFAYQDCDLRAIYRGPYKLVTINGEMAEVYNLERDPGETINLLDKEREEAYTLENILAEILEDMLFPPAMAEIEGDEEEKAKRERLIKQLKAVGYL